MQPSRAASRALPDRLPPFSPRWGKSQGCQRRERETELRRHARGRQARECRRSRARAAGRNPESRGGCSKNKTAIHNRARARPSLRCHTSRLSLPAPSLATRQASVEAKAATALFGRQRRRRARASAALLARTPARAPREYTRRKK